MALSPSTLRVYVSTLRRVYGIDPTVPPFVEGTDIAGLPPARYNEDTTNSTRSIIRGAVRWWYSTANNPEATALGERIANAIPFRHEVKKRKRYPSSEEIARYWRAIYELPTPKRELLAIPLTLGLRANELLLLSRTAVEEAVRTGVITVQRKGAKEGELPVKPAVEFFRSLLKAKRYTTTVKDEGPWTVLWQLIASTERGAYWQLRRLVTGTAKAIGLESTWTPHTLRHAFASEMIRAGAPLSVVQRALGHASYLTTVNTYVHIDTKDLEKWMDRPGVKPPPEPVAPIPAPVPTAAPQPVPSPVAAPRPVQSPAPAPAAPSPAAPPAPVSAPARKAEPVWRPAPTPPVQPAPKPAPVPVRPVLPSTPKAPPVPVSKAVVPSRGRAYVDPSAAPEPDDLPLDEE